MFLFDYVNILIVGLHEQVDARHFLYRRRISMQLVKRACIGGVLLLIAPNIFAQRFVTLNTSDSDATDCWDPRSLSKSERPK